MTDKYTQALHKIDVLHEEDPKIITSPSSPTPIPYELHYANKMTKYLTLREPSAPETLRLAIRAQHLKRWEVPRSSYPATKLGYHAWRSGLQKRQADMAEAICREVGYSPEEASRVAALVRKEGLKGGDPQTQVLEDVACLVFLDDQFEEFEKGYDEEKVVGILKKTWAKMSEQGRELALKIDMSNRAKSLVVRALEE
ncbi:hypothetical protein BDV25DRAFT_70738 [Aspergillus avenaceus]|uniref:Glutamyl-tRNA synthetase n=1 Tax=Aspergillus avenaceus TaxID=36643 RepID=A0A5N6TGK5_ASPAV|nr:hypothetical protein BDV25DRAFT_70738 [Aspergillus avenaceus]